MIEKRIRDQTNYTYLVKSTQSEINYRVIDVQRKSMRDFSIEKNEKLFSGLKYNTKQIPNFVDCNLTKFFESLKINNQKKEYGGKILL